jgi:hypothetical protein
LLDPKFHINAESAVQVSGVMVNILVKPHVNLIDCVTSVRNLTNFEEVMKVMWTLKNCSFLNWEQLWLEYVHPSHPEENCKQWKEQMENQLGYPILHADDGDEESADNQKG